jgi:dTDP-4-dehydrorhamnose reductase
MTEKPFLHKKAFANVKTSFMYHEDVAKILFKLINKRGVINIGGRAEFVYNFAKENNPKVKKIFLKKDNKIGMPFDSSLNIKKLQKMIKINLNN